MAYVNMSGVEYDRGGRVRTLLGEVRYDDGGRVRTLLGHEQLGQDDLSDLPLTSADTWTPITSVEPSPGPVLPDNWYNPGGPISTDQFGNLNAPAPVIQTPSGFQVPANSPLLNSAFTPSGTLLQTTSAPITGTLAPPAPAGPVTVTASTSLPAATGIIASAENLLKSIFGGSMVQAAGVPGTQTGVVTPAGQAMAAAGQLVSPSWFTDPAQEVVAGVPNWGIAAGIGLLGVMLFAGGRESSRYSVRRRKNPAELILMGANPSYRRRHRVL